MLWPTVCRVVLPSVRGYILYPWFMWKEMRGRWGDALMVKEPGSGQVWTRPQVTALSGQHLRAAAASCPGSRAAAQPTPAAQHVPALSLGRADLCSFSFSPSFPVPCSLPLSPGGTLSVLLFVLGLTLYSWEAKVFFYLFAFFFFLYLCILNFHKWLWAVDHVS